jgi:hypothetical protein
MKRRFPPGVYRDEDLRCGQKQLHLIKWGVYASLSLVCRKLDANKAKPRK